MGNQGHSRDDARQGQEYLMSGVIGDVREVHVWTDRPLGFWPQGLPRPVALTADPTTIDTRGSGGRDSELTSATVVQAAVVAVSATAPQPRK